MICSKEHVLIGCNPTRESPVLPEEGDEKEEPRVLGLAMIPGHHIVSIEVDVNKKEFLPEAAIGSRNSMDCDMAEEPAPTACEGATA